MQDNFSTLRRIADAGTPATIFTLSSFSNFLFPLIRQVYSISWLMHCSVPESDTAFEFER